MQFPLELIPASRTHSVFVQMPQNWLFLQSRHLSSWNSVNWWLSILKTSILNISPLNHKIQWLFAWSTSKDPRNQCLNRRNFKIITSNPEIWSAKARSKCGPWVWTLVYIKIHFKKSEYKVPAAAADIVLCLLKDTWHPALGRVESPISMLWLHELINFVSK